jgi:hypothetical protein
VSELRRHASRECIRAAVLLLYAAAWVGGSVERPTAAASLKSHVFLLRRMID